MSISETENFVMLFGMRRRCICEEFHQRHTCILGRGRAFDHIATLQFVGIKHKIGQRVSLHEPDEYRKYYLHAHVTEKYVYDQPRNYYFNQRSRRGILVHISDTKPKVNDFLFLIYFQIYSQLPRQDANTRVGKEPEETFG